MSAICNKKAREYFYSQARNRTKSVVSFIRTLTVGFGISPNQPQLPKKRRVADFDRR